MNTPQYGYQNQTPINNTPPTSAPPTARAAHEHLFRTHDGVDLFYRHWPAAPKRRRGAVALFHGGHEHGGRMAHLVDELNLPDFDFFAWDARGHGRSPGQRGHSPSLAHSVRDVQTFVDHIDAAHGVAERDQYIVAQGVGAALVAAWAHDYAPGVRGITLASPAFQIKLHAPLAWPALALMYKRRGLFFVSSHVKARFLTHDAARIVSFERDPLVSRVIAVNILLDLYAAAERVVTDANAITAPVQLLVSGADRVARTQPQRRFFERLGSAVKEKIELPGFFHDTLGERERAPAVARVRAFILQQFDAPAPAVDLLDADRRGATFEEARALAAPLPALSPRGLYWSAARAVLRVGSLFSDCLRLGHTTGFDSGSMFDYMYRNQTTSASLFGRLIDRSFLDGLGWRGVRQRKLYVEELMREAMRRLQADGAPVRLIDLAAGHGRYVLDAVASSTVPVESILLRDYSDINVRDGQRLIAERSLQDRAQFVQADAFDRASLAAVTPRPTLAIACGLYELFADNGMVRASLDGVADAVPPGGYLIYTNLSWHPQLEMIARALTTHRQRQAWVMRRRTQAEIDQLVTEAGFQKIAQRIDPWGIITTSLARREAGRSASTAAHTVESETL
jgi:alpha-beta hydrolase superfamily lysophospholipase